MAQQKDLDARVGEYYCCPDCGHMVDYAKVESYKRSVPEALMDMDLLDFFRQNSDFYDEKNRYTKQQARTVIQSLYYGGEFGKKGSIRKVGDLYKFTDEDLSAYVHRSNAGFGAKTLGAINDTLGKAGLPLIQRSNDPYYNRTLYSKPASSVSVVSPSSR